MDRFLHHQIALFHLAMGLKRPTIHSTMPSRYTMRQNQCSQGLYNSSHHGNVHILGYAASPFQGRSTIYATTIVDTGKGSNSVISNLYHFFAHHRLGGKHSYLHADNCAGQNKNNILLRYIAWQVMAGLHKSITVSFLLVFSRLVFWPDETPLPKMSGQLSR